MWKILSSISVLNLVSVDVNKETVASSGCGRLKANCDVSEANAAWDDRSKASSAIGVQVECTDSGDVADLVDENDVLAEDLAGNSSGVVGLTERKFVIKSIFMKFSKKNSKLPFNSRVKNQRIRSDSPNNQVVSCNDDPNERKKRDSHEKQNFTFHGFFKFLTDTFNNFTLSFIAKINWDWVRRLLSYRKIDRTRILSRFVQRTLWRSRNQSASVSSEKDKIFPLLKS